jgi:membrane-bound lytic murein transglycosylase A
MRVQVLVVAAALWLCACAERPQAPRPLVTLAPPAAPTHNAPPNPVTQTPIAFADLPGWAGEDHRAALEAVRADCLAGKALDPAGVCLRLAWLDAPGEAAAREFLERNFRPVALGEPGVLTGYFTPVYEARHTADAEFSEPVRPRPTRSFSAERREIDAWPCDDALAWMRAEDLFFLQIQGSGVLVFPDGQRLKAAYDGANNAPFTGIATPMRARGLLGHDASGEAIRSWLASNRGAAAREVMDLDRHYVFFRLAPDDGAPPAGAAGVRLIPGRALAVDMGAHRMGEVFWIDAEAPILPGAFPTYQRLAVALDTGAAIRGQIRADLYLGEGEAAGVEAGRVRHTLKLYRLEPVGPPPQ